MLREMLGSRETASRIEQKLRLYSILNYELR